MALPDLRFNLQFFAGEKTEPATPKRRQEARKKGQVARTGELSTALLLFGTALAFHSLIGRMGERLLRFFQTALQDYLTMPELTGEALVGIGRRMTALVLSTSAPVMVAALLLGVGTQVIQVGVRFSSEALLPKFSRINPAEGFKRIFSKRSVVELLKASFKIGIVGYLAYSAVRGSLGAFSALVQLPPSQGAGYVGEAVYRLAVQISLVLLFLAAWDYLYQRWEFEQSIRMSKQEVKEELRQTEGDPQVRSRIRAKQRELARNRISAAVPTADVVVTNPTHYAVALKYDMDTMNAPTVVAKGAGFLAKRIKELALDHNVPMVENVYLARSLYEQVEVGQEISAELYQAVAEVLAYVYRLRNRH